jgi:hypothetical protein
MDNTQAMRAALEFADHIINGVFEGGDWDGSDLQDLAVKFGLLRIETMPEACSEECACRCNGSTFPTECYRKTYLAAISAAPSSGEEAGQANVWESFDLDAVDRALEGEDVASLTQPSAPADKRDLPPFPDHPEPQIMKWSELEKRTIREYAEAYARTAVEQAMAQQVPVADEREAFEAWWQADGKYRSQPKEKCFKAFLAGRAALAQQVPVAEVDEGDDGLFVAILYGENGSPLKRGDKLYLSAAAPLRQALDCYDAGYINDFGGGDVAWWRDYLLAELGRAYDHYQTQVDSWNENAAPLAQPAVPPDYVIVPKEPTPEMLRIGGECAVKHFDWLTVYRAMIAAAEKVN